MATGEFDTTDNTSPSAKALKDELAHADTINGRLIHKLNLIRELVEPFGEDSDDPLNALSTEILHVLDEVPREEAPSAKDQ